MGVKFTRAYLLSHFHHIMMASKEKETNPRMKEGLIRFHEVLCEEKEYI